MDIQLVEEEQILQRSIPISYLQSARIRCCIEQTLVDSIEAKMQQLYSWNKYVGMLEKGN